MRRLICLTLSLCGLLPLILVAPAQASAGRFALLVGVGQFTGRTAPNPGSANDAADVRQLLLRHGWQDSNIRVLTDSAATASAIRSGLSWLASNCGSGSVCVFKYSGHVKLLNAPDGDSERVDEALWSYENAFIPDGEVAQQLRRLQGKSWVDISGCEAAGFNDNLASSSLVFTASSQENEKSYESPAYRNSVWTERLVNQGLAGKAAGSLAQAYEYASPLAAAETAKQRRGPQHAYMAGGDPNWWFSPAMSEQPSAQAGGSGFCLIIFCF